MRVAYVFASYDLRVSLIMRVASCELNERCELETQKCELKPKVRVACFLLQKGLFRQIKRYSKVAFQYATTLWVFF